MLGLGLSNTVGEFSENLTHNQGSLNFDGSNDYVQIDNLTSLLSANWGSGTAKNVEFSISAWIRAETMATTGVVFNARVGTSTENHIILLWHGSGNSMRFTSKFNNTAVTTKDGDDFTIMGTGAENNGSWYHVLGTISKSNSLQEFWINGTKVSSKTMNNQIQGAIDGMNIGTNTQESNFWNGDIDELAVWNRKLTDDEISIISNARDKHIDLQGQVGDELIGYYRFEEKSGSTAVNSAFNNTGTDGTLVNSPTYTTNIA
tara:strand:+ start:7064 stop:7843 length:780 start_codon:yes stop_codon:yes gene_type:complete